MNFEIIDNKNFRLDGQSYPRIFFITKKNNGKVRLANSYDYTVLVDEVEVLSITINNNPIENLDALQEVIFRRNCLCGNMATPSEKASKIFSPTFDKTFE